MCCPSLEDDKRGVARTSHPFREVFLSDVQDPLSRSIYITLRGLGYDLIPSCGACLSNMAVAPDGTVLPCQSWLSGPGLGNILHDPWNKIWNAPACRRIRRVSARMEHICQLGDPRRQKEEA